MSGICLAQSDPTTFTNANLPKPEPQSLTFNFYIATEDGRAVGACPSNSGGCRIYVRDPYGVAITLPDIPNQYVNHARAHVRFMSKVMLPPGFAECGVPRRTQSVR